MGVFYHEEPPNHSKRCKYFVATLKEVLFQCQTFRRQLSISRPEEEYSISDFDEEYEVIVSAVKSRAMEKLKHKPIIFRDSFSWVYSPETREFYVTQKMAPKEKEGGNEEHDESEEFLSVKSCFSCYSSLSANGETFYSVKTNLSRCSSLNEVVDLSEYWRRSIIQEFCHCEGWPFGLCRKAVLLPPLPKSPTESWLSRKIQPSSPKVT